MKKSGLADSPFFAPQVKTVPTPPSPTPTETSVPKDNNIVLPSPTPVKTDEKIVPAQNENNQDQKRTNVLSDVRTDERTFERTVVHPSEKPKRRKIRHAFDIYQDQLLSLQMRQLEAVQRGKRKPKLGKMVQDAIDLYLKQPKNQK